MSAPITKKQIQEPPASGEALGWEDLYGIREAIEGLSDEVSYAKRPHVSGRIVESANPASTSRVGVDLASASTTLVKHGLGRKPRGWVVISRDANSTVWEDTTNTASRKVWLPLKCSADVTVKLLVF